MSRTFHLSILLLTVLFLSLVSCSKDSSKDKTITLHLTSWWYGKEEVWQENVVKPYEAEHPNIKVKVTSVVYGTYYPKLLASAASGAQFGDVVLVDDAYALDLFQRGYARDLMPYIRRDLNLNDFFSSPIHEWHTKTDSGAVMYGFPPCAGVTVFFYNKDLFDKAGVPYPDSNWTYDTLLNAAKKMTVDTNHDGVIDQWGIWIGVNNFLLTLIHAYGGRIVSEDFSRVMLNEPEAQRAVQFAVDLIHKHKVAPSPSSPGSVTNYFATGQAAMFIEGDFHLTYFKECKFRWDVALPPKGPAGRSSRRYSPGFCIPRSSEHPDEAWELLKWILTYPRKTAVASVLNEMIPAYKPLAKSKEWMQRYPNIDANILLEIYEKYSFSPITPGWLEWTETAYGPEMDNAFALRKTVPQATEGAAREINRILKSKLTSSGN
jgi:multiple sugar transport system substrate-binding protein